MARRANKATIDKFEAEVIDAMEVGGEGRGAIKLGDVIKGIKKYSKLLSPLLATVIPGGTKWLAIISMVAELVQNPEEDTEAVAEPA